MARKIYTPEDLLENLLCRTFGKESVYELGWDDAFIIEARKQYVEYSKTDTEYLKTLPYDYESPLGIFRGTLEVLIQFLDDDDVEGHQEHYAVWRKLPELFPECRSEITHSIN